MKAHATEDSDAPKTLCGRDRKLVKVDNVEPDCLSCIKLIRLLCFDHGVRSCEICPADWRCGEGLAGATRAANNKDRNIGLT